MIYADESNFPQETSDLDILAKLEPVRNAGYQAGHHDKCLPGTRQSVLHDIMHWATNPRDPGVLMEKVIPLRSFVSKGKYLLRAQG